MFTPPLAQRFEVVVIAVCLTFLLIPAHSMAFQTTSMPQAKAKRSLGRRAVQQTEAVLLYRRGLRYDQGPRKDYSAALESFRRAAERGHPAASYQLARMYIDGRGIPRDPSMGFYWLQRAADRGHAAAQYQLGKIYELAASRPGNTEKATQWYRKAAAQGQVEAQYALMAMKNSMRATNASAPAVALARSSDPVLGTVDYLDRLAHQKQKDFAKKFASKRDSFNREWRQLIDAELKLSRAFDHAWASIPYTRRVPVEVSQPLSLGMFQLQSEVRRRLGPKVHTIVPGLVTAPGCKKDFVNDRVISRYALAVTGEDHGAAVETLKEEAIQVACLGRRQLADLEWAVSTGFEEVAAKMRQRGLGEVVPLLAQMLAPVQLLILDGRKHRGERSLSWKWFVTYGPDLKRLNAAQSHWPTANLYLWSRTSALLVGFPMCLPGTSATQCVDLQRFLDSLMDPRAIGLGDCALSGMIANGVSTIQGDQRYVCPTLTCGETAPGVSSITGSAEMSEARERLGIRWPSSGSADDVLVEQTEGTGQLCRNPSDGSSLQGAGPLSSECLNSVFGQDKNPWDTYATCMGEAAGAGVPEVGVAPLPGVPMGQKCGLMEEGGSTPTPAPSTPADTSDEEKKEAEDEKPPPDIIPLTTTPGTTPSRDQVDAPKTKEDADRSIWQTLREFFRAHLGGAVRPASDSDREERQRLNAETLRQQREGAKSCADETACPDDCTGLGSQIAKTKDCTDQLLTAFSEALGRKRPQPQPGEVGPPRGRVIIYDPENAPLPESDIGACVMGTQGPSPQGGNVCRFVLCPGTAGLATPIGTDCGCGQGTQPYKSVEKLCMLDCVGELIDGNCKCAPSELSVERMPETIPTRSPSADRPPANRDRVP
jgi:hypothetical protein